MNRSLDVSISVHCKSIEEANVAVEAIREFRRHGTAISTSSDETASPQEAIAERIELALGKHPLNHPRQIVLQQLLSAAPEVWVPYPDIQGVLENEGLGKEQAQAALRDLSWQMKEFLPTQDVASFSRKIEVMAERSRSGGTYRYRLTAAGRMAVGRFLPKAVIG